MRVNEPALNKNPIGQAASPREAIPKNGLRLFALFAAGYIL